MLKSLRASRRKSRLRRRRNRLERTRNRLWAMLGGEDVDNLDEVLLEYDKEIAAIDEQLRSA